jgi:VWFA-related protein
MRTRFVVLLAFVVTVLTGGMFPSAQRSSGEVELDVVAVDDQNRPVPGLRREAFKVQENGRAVAIDSFTEVVPPGNPGRDARSVVLLLDDTGVPPELTATVQRIARLFTARVGRDDRLSVVRLNHRSDEASGDRSVALSRIASYRGGMIPLFGRETIENALGRVASISRQLETFEHRRKVIVCIGSPDVFDITQPPKKSGSLIWPYWVSALQSASRANVGVYLIDPAGATGALKIRGSEALTAETGGESFVNSNAFETAVDRIWNEAGHYYLLGYSPAMAGDELREVEVKAAASNVRVRARKARG